MLERGFNYKILIHDRYKDLLKKDIYEPILLKIMNHSTRVFHEEYKQIKEQSNNESDFVSNSNAMFDAKLLFYKKQCEALAVNKDNLTSFMNGIKNETYDISNAIENGDIKAVRECIFYKEMKKEIEKAKDGENIILFLPYAFTLEFKDSITASFTSDIFSYIYRVLKKDYPELYRNNCIYMIYINFLNEIIIKNLSKNIIEFLELDVFNNYIGFEIK